MHIDSNTSTWGQSFISKQIYTQLDSKPLSEVHIVVNFHLIDALSNNLASNIALLTTFMTTFLDNFYQDPWNVFCCP